MTHYFAIVVLLVSASLPACGLENAPKDDGQPEIPVVSGSNSRGEATSGEPPVDPPAPCGDPTWQQPSDDGQVFSDSDVDVYSESTDAHMAIYDYGKRVVAHANGTYSLVFSRSSRYCNANASYSKLVECRIRRNLSSMTSSLECSKEGELILDVLFAWYDGEFTEEDYLFDFGADAAFLFSNGEMMDHSRYERVEISDALKLGSCTLDTCKDDLVRPEIPGDDGIQR